MNVLDRLDLSLKLPDEEYDERLPKLQARLHALQVACARREVASVIAFEGWDAAGKGGAIRRVTPMLDPRAFEVIPIAAPTTEEAQHHYLWRFWRAVPEAGKMTIFDRTWYGRVLVERVEGYCTSEEWKRAYGEIVQFEDELAENGTVVAKFWLHISKAEQLRRFQERSDDRIKRYKIGPDDWRNRKKWNVYAKAVDEMVRRTSRPRARWTLVEAEDKRYARVKVLETIIAALERGLDAPSPAKRFRKIERKLRKLR